MSVIKVVEQGDADKLRSLLESGKPVNETNKKGETPLMIACQSGQEDLVSILVEKGADLNAKDKKGGRTALIHACISGFSDIVSTLLSHKVNVNATDSEGMTALHWAISGGSDDTVKLLVDRGSADVNAKNKAGYTPLHTLAVTTTGQEDGLVRSLVERGALIDKTDPSGNTPLAIAAATGNEAVVKALLDAGANIDAANEDGDTPLIQAASEGNLGAVRILIERGANINAKNKEGHNAIDATRNAEDGNDEDHRRVIEFLSQKSGIEPSAHVPSEEINQSKGENQESKTKSNTERRREEKKVKEEELAQWLDQIGLGKYLPQFRKWRLDLDSLKTTEDFDLKKMGIVGRNDQETLMKAIYRLKGVEKDVQMKSHKKNKDGVSEKSNNNNTLVVMSAVVVLLAVLFAIFFYGASSKQSNKS